MSGLLTHLQRAAAGEEEPAEAVTVLGALDGSADSVTFLPGQVVVAADVDRAWVAETLGPLEEHPPEDRSRVLGRFVAATVQHLGGPSACVSVLAVAPRRAALVRGSFAPARHPDPAWTPYRTEVVARRFDSPGVVGAIDVGRGPGGRWDTTVRVEGDARGGGGDSRQLLAAALSLVPRGEDLYVSAPVHDPRALRTLLSGGFRPLGVELLLLTRPDAAGAGAVSTPDADSDRERSGSWFSRLFRGSR